MSGGRLHLGWVIDRVSEDGDGIVVELAHLGGGKSMIVVTDTAAPVAPSSYRQAGFGPFDGQEIDSEIVTKLKADLMARRPKEMG